MDYGSFIGAFSGVWMALFFIIFVACGTFAASMDSIFLSAIVLAGSAGALQFLAGVAILPILIANPLLIIALIAVHIAIGAGFTTWWLWPEHLNDQSAYIQYSFKRWVDGHGKQLEGKTRSEKFEIFLDSDHYAQWHPSKNKERLMTWILMWPFAMGWELVHGPITMIYNALADKFVAIGKDTARKNIKLD